MNAGYLTWFIAGFVLAVLTHEIGHGAGEVACKQATGAADCELVWRQSK